MRRLSFLVGCLVGFALTCVSYGVWHRHLVVQARFDDPLGVGVRAERPPQIPPPAEARPPRTPPTWLLPSGRPRKLADAVVALRRVERVEGYLHKPGRPEYRTEPWELPREWETLWRERRASIDEDCKKFEMSHTRTGIWTVGIDPSLPSGDIGPILLSPETISRERLAQEEVHRAHAWSACVWLELTSADVQPGAPAQLQVRLPLPESTERYNALHRRPIPPGWRTEASDPDSDGYGTIP